jgi:hypothetical protein
MVWECSVKAGGDPFIGLGRGTGVLKAGNGWR